MKTIVKMCSIQRLVCFFAMGFFVLTSCVSKHSIIGQQAYQSCSILPTEEWLSQTPISTLCIREGGLAPIEPTRVVFHVKATDKLFKEGTKVNKNQDLDMPGTCYLLKNHPDKVEKILQTMNEKQMATPPSKYSYEIWSDVEILYNGSGYLHNYIEVLKSGEDVWLTTSLCSPS